MATRQTNPAPAVSIEVEHCTHGAPKVVEEDRIAAIHGYVERYEKLILEFQTKCQQTGTEFGDHKAEMTNASFAALEQFWSDPKHASLIDAKLVRFCFAYATLLALRGDMDVSHHLAFLGIYLATWFKLGKDTFLGVLRGMPMEISDQKTIYDFRESIGKIGSERGLVLFLSKQIPCSCLDEDKKNAKEAPKSGWCNYCNSEGPKSELKKCSRCKSAHYCSKKCQVADWKAGHKKKCETFKRFHEQHAMFKAQARR
jgi:hypothetical protein